MNVVGLGCAIYVDGADCAMNVADVQSAMFEALIFSNSRWSSVELDDNRDR